MKEQAPLDKRYNLNLDELVTFFAQNQDRVIEVVDRKRNLAFTIQKVNEEYVIRDKRKK